MFNVHKQENRELVYVLKLSFTKKFVISGKEKKMRGYHIYLLFVVWFLQIMVGCIHIIQMHWCSCYT